MARVRYSKFAGRKGATLKCSKDGAEIAVGETYAWFKPGFRSRYKVVRCMKHLPRPSETMTSKMAGVVAAGETANDALDALTDPQSDLSSIEQILQDAASEIEAVADEYREAAEASPTGMIFGEDYNDRADEIADAASTLEQWSADNEEPEYTHEQHDLAQPDDDGEIEQEEADPEKCDECADERQTWWDDAIQSARDALDEAMNI